jgi:hypothetical protein
MYKNKRYSKPPTRFNIPVETLLDVLDHVGVLGMGV